MNPNIKIFKFCTNSSSIESRCKYSATTFLFLINIKQVYFQNVLILLVINSLQVHIYINKSNYCRSSLEVGNCFVSLRRVLQNTLECPADIIQAASLLVVPWLKPHTKTLPSTNPLQRRHVVQQLALASHTVGA